jgi:hypothetical protein
MKFLLSLLEGAAGIAFIILDLGLMGLGSLCVGPATADAIGLLLIGGFLTGVGVLILWSILQGRSN